VTWHQPSEQQLAASYAGQAVESLRAWPTLVMVRDGEAVTFSASDREIIRLHDHGTADLHLTSPVIDRLIRTLDASVHLDRSAEPGWVIIRLEDSMALHALLSLVSVALKANL
jgi:hypothetical protein